MLPNRHLLIFYLSTCRTAEDEALAEDEEMVEEIEEVEEEAIVEEYEENEFGDDAWYWDEVPSSYDDDWFEDEYWVSSECNHSP
jgi:hypothetical protein